MFVSLYRYLYKNVLRPFLFQLDSDKIHQIVLNYGYMIGNSALGRKIIEVSFSYENKALEQEILGINFKNPVGLSAGFDKDGDLINIMPSVGFGFMQVGSVTLEPYEGNKMPWAKRLLNSNAILVNYGLKNIGAKRFVRKIKNNGIPKNIPLGISVAKTNSKETVEDKNGIEDYYKCLSYIVKNRVGDFYTINISCPNVFGGEPFTDEAKLDSLLKQLLKVKHNKPMFLKMPINISWNKFKKLCEIAVKNNIDGVIIGNLNKDVGPYLAKNNINEKREGSLSGKPTEKLSNELISKTYKRFGSKLIIIGVGGIFSAEDAYEKIKRGASLVQLITGMIFEGPQLIGGINQDLVKLIKKDGYKNISQAVGSYHKR